MKKGIKVIIGFVLAIALAASGFWMVHRFIESKEQQANFQDLVESVLLDKPKVPVKTVPNLDKFFPRDDPMAPTDDETPKPTGPEVFHDLAALKEKNADCIGWIRVPGTDINYPIMWTPSDPEHYLHLDFPAITPTTAFPFWTLGVTFPVTTSSFTAIICSMGPCSPTCSGIEKRITWTATAKSFWKQPRVRGSTG